MRRKIHRLRFCAGQVRIWFLQAELRKRRMWNFHGPVLFILWAFPVTIITAPGFMGARSVWQTGNETCHRADETVRPGSCFVASKIPMESPEKKHSGFSGHRAPALFGLCGSRAPELRFCGTAETRLGRKGFSNKSDYSFRIGYTEHGTGVFLQPIGYVSG